MTSWGPGLEKEPQSIRVEFYGIPRRRAGVASLDVAASNLEEAFEQIAAALPAMAESCLAHGRLQPGYLANLNGTRFTTDPSTPLNSGDTLLILSADVGG